jgi:hypothetical protein
MNDDEALRHLSAQIMELGVGADTVAMMRYELASASNLLQDRPDACALQRRHPVAGARESDLPHCQRLSKDLLCSRLRVAIKDRIDMLHDIGRDVEEVALVLDRD